MPAAMRRLRLSHRPKRPLMRALLWVKTGGHCWYCGENVSIDASTIDHKTPQAASGKTVESNLVLACQSCNHEKDALSLEAYRTLKGITRFWGERHAD